MDCRTALEAPVYTGQETCGYTDLQETILRLITKLVDILSTLLY